MLASVLGTRMLLILRVLLLVLRMPVLMPLLLPSAAVSCMLNGPLRVLLLLLRAFDSILLEAPHLATRCKRSTVLHRTPIPHRSRGHLHLQDFAAAGCPSFPPD